VDTTPVVTVTTVDGLAREQSPLLDSLPDLAELRVHRTGDVAEPLTVFYLVRGTATNGKDYALLRGEVQVPAGESAVSLIIEPIDDNESEPAETVAVSIIPKEIAPGDETPPGYYRVGLPETAHAAILDDDEPPVNLPPVVAIVSPPPGALLPLSREIRITAEASDPDGWVSSVEFFVDGQSIGLVPGGTWSPEVTQPADAVSEPDWRPPHHFQLIWERPTPGPHLLTAIASDNLGENAESSPVEIQLLEIPEPTVVHVIASDPEGAEGPLDDTLAAIPDPARFTLVRSGHLDMALRVYFKLGGTAVNGLDYQESPSSVEMAEGQRSLEIVIHPIDDASPERTENVTLTVIPPVCIEIFPPPPECYLVGTPSTARVFIHDNDSPGNLPPQVRLVVPQDGQVMRAPAEVRLTAVAWDPDGAVVSVEFFAGDRSLGVVTESDPVPLPADLGEVDDPSLMLPRYSLLWTDVAAGQYSLSARADDSQGASTHSAPAQLWVMDAAEPQWVTVEASDPEASEPQELSLGPDGQDTGRFTIHRSGPTEMPLTVYYQLSGAAVNGVDYELLAQHAFIPSGESSVDLEVRPLHDEQVEGIEHVELRLLPVWCWTNPDGTQSNPYVVGEPGSARVAIQDDDLQGNVPPRVKLARPVDGEVIVAPREIELVAVVQDPDGWVPAVQFYAGDRLIGTSEIVFIREPDPGLPQTFSFVWSDVPPGRHELRARAIDDEGTGSWSQAVHISVRQSELLQIVTIEATDPRASEGGLLTVVDAAVFTVQRSGDLAEPLTVFYSIGGSAENGVDYQELSGLLEIPPGSASATIEINPFADRIEEEVETVIVRVEPPACPAIYPPPPGCYMVGEPGWALAGIVDGPNSGNLPPRTEIVRPFPGAIYHAPANIAIATQARDPDGYVTLVEWFANDRKIGEQTMQFLLPPPPGELQVFEFHWQDVPAGKYLLTTRATDDQGAVSALSEPVSVVVLTGDDVPVVTVFVADPLASERVSPDGSVDTAAFKIRRSGALDRALTVFFNLRGTAENGVDYALLDWQVTLPAGSRWAHVTVTPVEDGLPEDPETVVLELIPSPTMGPIDPYHIGEPKLAAALIFDNVELDAPTERVRNWLHLRLPGEPGSAYRLEVSEDLLEWQALGEGRADDSGMHHVETAPEDFPRRFYRLRPLAPSILENSPILERDW
jgi:hypothetical protein